MYSKIYKTTAEIRNLADQMDEAVDHIGKSINSGVLIPRLENLQVIVKEVGSLARTVADLKDKFDKQHNKD